MTTPAERASRARVDKFGLRRRMLAETALTTIAERGFARTGLREIAQNSDLSHGVLHYYFEGKDDLVAEAVWNYKSECARRYDGVVASATSGDELIAGVAEEMAATLRDEASLHRLWYDLRNQSLFDEGFRETIIEIDALLEEMVWAIVERYAELVGRPPAFDRGLAYGLVDGLFQNELIRFLRGDTDAVDRIRRDCAALLGSAA
jgi:AcrR family transcriptional regulator